MSDSEASESQHYTLDESAGPGNTESIEKTNTQINKNIRTLAEAIQALHSDISELKRKAKVDPSELTGQSSEKQACALGNAPESSSQSKGQDWEPSCVSPTPGTSTDNVNKVEATARILTDLWRNPTMNTAKSILQYIAIWQTHIAICIAICCALLFQLTCSILGH